MVHETFSTETIFHFCEQDTSRNRLKKKNVQGFSDAAEHPPVRRASSETSGNNRIKWYWKAKMGEVINYSANRRMEHTYLCFSMAEARLLGTSILL